MLNAILTTHRESVIAKTREKLARRCSPPVSASSTEFEVGVPMLIAQLFHALQSGTEPMSGSSQAIGQGEATYANALRALDLDITQVVDGYSVIYDAIVEVALEQQIAISSAEMETLTRCLNTVAAEAMAVLPRPAVVTRPARRTASAIR